MDTESQIERTLRLNASPAEVWDALTNPAKTTQFMFNCAVNSDWTPGSPITWKGNYQGYESGERGTILACEEPRLLAYTSFDPNFGLEDVTANYLHIRYRLEEQDGGTLLTTTIENFNGDAERIKHIAKGWDGVVLPALTKVVESGN